MWDDVFWGSKNYCFSSLFSSRFLRVFFQSFAFLSKIGGEWAKSRARRLLFLEFAKFVDDSSLFPHRDRQGNHWTWASPSIFWSFATPRFLSIRATKGRQNKTAKDDVFYVFTVFAPLGHAKTTRILDGFYDFSGFSSRALRKRSKNEATKNRVPQKWPHRATGVKISCFLDPVLDTHQNSSSFYLKVERAERVLPTSVVYLSGLGNLFFLRLLGDLGTLGYGNICFF